MADTIMESVYTRFVYSYLLPVKFGIDKRMIIHSALACSGGMTHQQVLADLREAPNLKERVDDDVEYVTNKLGLTSQDLKEIMALLPKSFRDYPSYYALFKNPLVRVGLK